ncbi:protein claret segregational-like [Sitodiplosis mosellana]|uniref:protein claret segregational-like n=1 Tax=Sitodiplosis mosellana TaxID=263140 RepID=UPI0024444309|nr:protein claret segregational-like [Sitodiplosis mosellana]
MKTIILNIATHLNRKNVPELTTIRNKLLRRAKKVCDEITEDDIIFDNEPSGLVVKISCPQCSKVKLLSKTSGENCFSLFNFKNHYDVAHKVATGGQQMTNPNQEPHRRQSMIDLISLDVPMGNAGVVSVEPDDQSYNMLKKRFDDLSNENLILKTELDQRAATIEGLMQAGNQYNSVVAEKNAYKEEYERLTQKNTLSSSSADMNELHQQAAKIEELRQKLLRAGAEYRNVVAERDGYKLELEKINRAKTISSSLADLHISNITSVTEQLHEKIQRIKCLEEENDAFRLKITSKAKFSANLCFFDGNADENEAIRFEGNSVQFKDCQDRAVWLYFDNIYRGESAEMKFKNALPYLDAFLGGKNACIFTHGTTGSGKSCTMFGINNSVGLLASSIDYILKQGHRLNMNVIEVFKKEIYDLGEGKKRSFKLTVKAKNVQITSFGRFEQVCNKVKAIRTQKSTNQNATSSRSHIMFRFNVETKPEITLALVDLAGWESPYGKDDMQETIFINSTLMDFNKILASVAGNKCVTSTTLLSQMFKPYLTGNSVVCMFYHVAANALKKGLENIKDVVPSAKGDKMSTGTIKREPLRDLSNLSR